jgi:hypothetical protein
MNAFAWDILNKNDFSTYSLLLSMKSEKNPSKNVMMLWIGDR